MHKVNLRDIFQFLLSINESRFDIARQVNLTDVSIDNHFGLEAETCQKHLHLHDGGVLSFVQNHKGIIQRPPPHIG